MDSNNPSIEASWCDFDRYRRQAQGAMAELLHSPNPEIVLSTIDLLDAARETDVDNWFRQAFERGEEELPEFPYTAGSTEREDASVARRRFLDCLDAYFGSRHWRDSEALREGKLDYLGRELSWLECGDVVITTNWDTLAERLLAQAKKWHPAAGYGFQVDIERPGKSLPNWVRRPPEVKVLKLHGSFGWNRRSGRGRVYLRWADYLQHLFLGPEKDWLLVRDRNEVRTTETSLLAYPSYLKRVETAELQEIWHQASAAVACANEVKIIGYSLPESDTALRVLLNPLRFKLQEGATEITVVEPAADARRRWENSLGPEVRFDEQPIGADSGSR